MFKDADSVLDGDNEDVVYAIAGRLSARPSDIKLVFFLIGYIELPILPSLVYLSECYW